MKIGITERGDASIDYQWKGKLPSVDGAILITKNLTDQFIDTVIKCYENGDKLIVWGAGYTPQRGDVVIVDSYTSYGKPLVKRVIAKGGDTISIDYDAGTVEVNGELLQEDYIAAPTHLGYDVEFPYTVPEGTVFVMGDNRNESLDSRSSYVGCIDERDILGKVLLCFLPVSDFGVVK